MTIWLESRAAICTVTLIAVSSTTGIVRPGAAFEGCSGVTGTAIQSGRDVGGVGLGIHTNRCRAIMTGDTVINDAGMIEASTNEAGGGMTDATILVSCYMAV